MTARGWGWEEWGMTASGSGVSFGGAGMSVLERDGSDGCTTL